MSLIFFDGFEQYAPADLVTIGPWTSQTSAVVASVTPFTFGQSLALFGPTAFVSAAWPDRPSDTIVFGYNRIQTAGVYASSNMLVFYDINGGEVIQLRTDPNAQLAIEDAAGQFFYAEDMPAMSEDSWSYYEFKMSTVANTFEMAINNVVFQFTSRVGQTINLGALPISRVDISHDDAYIDDVYVDDGTAYLGDCRVIPLVPDADTVPNNWIKGGADPSAGTDFNYKYVHSVGGGDPIDASYVAINVAGAEEYTMTDLPAGTWDVKGVTMAARAFKESSGSPTMTLASDTGASEAGLIVPDTVVQVDTVQDHANGTDSGWSTAQVNGMTMTMTYVP